MRVKSEIHRFEPCSKNFTQELCEVKWNAAVANLLRTVKLSEGKWRVTVAEEC